MSNSLLRDAINDIVKLQFDNKSTLFFCKVLSIDTVNQTFTAQNIKGDSDDIIENCQINVGSGNNIVSMPAVDSQVLLIRDNIDNQYYMLKQDEISNANVSITGSVELKSRVSIDVFSPEFNIRPGYPNPNTKCKVEINGGLNGQVTNTDYLYDRLSELERVLKSWETLFLNWTPVAQDGGLALHTLYINERLADPNKFYPGITSATDLGDDNFYH